MSDRDGIGAAKDAVGATIASLIWLFAHIVAILGVTSLVYQICLKFGYLAPIVAPESWALIAKKATGFLARFGLFVVCLAIYFEKAERTPPSRLSRFISAPLFLVVSLVALFYNFAFGGLSPEIVDAITSIALGGAMMRLTGLPKYVST